MQLNTPRLILRDFKPTDGVAFAATRSVQSHFWHCEADLTEARSIELVELFVQWSLEVPRRRFQLAFVERGSDRLIGTLGVRLHSERETEADFGCELADFARGQGYAEEAAGVLFNWCFNTLPLERIVAQTLAGNLAARQLAERLGFVAEGSAPGQSIKNKWQPGLLMALARSDYFKLDT